MDLKLVLLVAIINQTEAPVCSTNHVTVNLVDVSFPALAISLYAASSPGAVKGHFVGGRRETGSVGLDGQAAKHLHRHAPRSNQRGTPGNKTTLYVFPSSCDPFMSADCCIALPTPSPTFFCPGENTKFILILSLQRTPNQILHFAFSF